MFGHLQYYVASFSEWVPIVCSWAHIKVHADDVVHILANGFKVFHCGSDSKNVVMHQQKEGEMRSGKHIAVKNAGFNLLKKVL